MASLAAPPSIADVPCRAADCKFISCRGGSEEGTGGAGCDPQPFAYGGARKGRSAMIIYGSVVSPFVRKLLGYLGEKGIEFELKGVGIGDPDPGFRADSQLGKMPAMADDGFPLADARAINNYAQAQPTGPVDRK